VYRHEPPRETGGIHPGVAWLRANSAEVPSNLWIAVTQNGIAFSADTVGLLMRQIPYDGVAQYAIAFFLVPTITDVPNAEAVMER
jgi:hypothetical protein